MSKNWAIARKRIRAVLRASAAFESSSPLVSARHYDEDNAVPAPSSMGAAAGLERPGLGRRRSSSHPPCADFAAIDRWWLARARRQVLSSLRGGGGGGGGSGGGNGGLLLGAGAVLLAAFLAQRALVPLWTGCVLPLRQSFASKTARAERFFKDHPISVESARELQRTRARWHREFRAFADEVEDDFEMCDIEWAIPALVAAMSWLFMGVLWAFAAVWFRERLPPVPPLPRARHTLPARALRRGLQLLYEVFVLSCLSPRALFRLSFALFLTALLAAAPVVGLVQRAVRLSQALALNVQQLKQLQLDLLTADIEGGVGIVSTRSHLAELDLFAHVWEGRRFGVLVPLSSARYGDKRIVDDEVDRRLRIDRPFWTQITQELLYQRAAPFAAVLSIFWWHLLHKRRWQAAIPRVVCVGLYMPVHGGKHEPIIHTLGSGSLIHPAGLVLTNWHLFRYELLFGKRGADAERAERARSASEGHAKGAGYAEHGHDNASDRTSIRLPPGQRIVIGTMPEGAGTRSVTVGSQRTLHMLPRWQYEACVVYASPARKWKRGGLDVALLRITGRLRSQRSARGGRESALAPLLRRLGSGSKLGDGGGEAEEDEYPPPLEAQLQPPTIFRLAAPLAPSAPLAEPLALPHFGLQESAPAGLRPGHSEVFLLGFPNCNLSVGSGGFFGVRFDDPQQERGKWLVAGVPMTFGNSGGAAVDAQGELVGVPSQTLGNMSELRCVDRWLVLQVFHAAEILRKQGAIGFERGRAFFRGWDLAVEQLHRSL
eukprot:g4117.t1